jgi:hypothetical protein
MVCQKLLQLEAISRVTSVMNPIHSENDAPVDFPTSLIQIFPWNVHTLLHPVDITDL